MQHTFPATLQSWRVYEDSLIQVAGQDSQDTVPGRVSFRADNTDLLADQGIEQGRFPDVRSPNDSDVATTGFSSFRHDRVSKAFGQLRFARPLGDFGRDPLHRLLSRRLRTPRRMTVDEARQRQILLCKQAN